MEAIAGKCLLFGENKEDYQIIILYRVREL